jgi:hypothetical protein
MTKPKTHLVIPDCQVRPDVDYTHLKWIGNYAAEKRPDSIICLGDFADMPSLSSYAVGKASAEGKRYADDIAATKEAMSFLVKPIDRQRAYKPAKVLTLGNHEDRIDREAEHNPKWKGFLSSADLGYKEAGWKVYPFLKVAQVDGFSYSHFFTSGNMGRPVSSAAALLRRRHSSSVMGHVQLQDIAIHPVTQSIGLFAGICYQHDEGYLGPQGNHTKRGVWMLHEIREGTADLMFVSLGFLQRRYS